MSRRFSFNAFEQPTLEVELRGGKIIHLEIPTVSAVERMRDALPSLHKRITQDNIGDLRKFYELLAELMSFNTEGVTITAEELEKTHRITLDAMVPFFTDYMAFIDEVRASKN